jgi:hypothetical protein
MRNAARVLTVGLHRHRLECITHTLALSTDTSIPA